MDYKYNRDRIIRAAIKGILATLPGGSVTLTDFHDVEDVQAGPTRKPAEIIAGLGEMDLEALHFYNAEGEEVGWIAMVHEWGCNPGEIMSDWTVNLEEGMTEALALSERIMDRWDDQEN